MMIDQNEIAGWINHCTNVDHLRHLLTVVRGRLDDLGANHQHGDRRPLMPGVKMPIPASVVARAGDDLD